jgi:hypothetical protein
VHTKTLPFFLLRALVRNVSFTNWPLQTAELQLIVMVKNRRIPDRSSLQRRQINLGNREKCRPTDPARRSCADRQSQSADRPTRLGRVCRPNDPPPSCRVQTPVANLDRLTHI